ncbi:MAG: ABC transporter permease [archaeon]
MDRWIGFEALVSREAHRMRRLFKDAILAPIVSSILYLLIFGVFIGNQFSEINGVAYIEFIVPGLIMLNVIQGAFSTTSFSLFLQRFQHSIDDILVSPMSYLSMVLAMSLGGVMRGLVVGITIYAVGSIFIGKIVLVNPLLFLFLLVLISFLFASLGLIVGLWAEEFEHLSLFPTFLIMPLTFLGGVFHSTTLLPEILQDVAKINPFFYFVDTFRYSMIGYADADVGIGIALIIVLTIGSVYATNHLFKKGYKLRA